MIKVTSYQDSNYLHHCKKKKTFLFIKIWISLISLYKSDDVSKTNMYLCITSNIYVT